MTIVANNSPIINFFHSIASTINFEDIIPWNGKTSIQHKVM